MERRLVLRLTFAVALTGCWGTRALVGPAATQMVVEPVRWAFHGGGPLLGHAEPIGAPPMRLRWQYAPPDGLDEEIKGQAAICGEVVYVADAGGGLRCLDLAGGKARWVHQCVGGLKTTPLVVGDTIYIGDSSGVFHAIASDGRERWHVETSGPIHASATAVIIKDGTATGPAATQAGAATRRAGHEGLGIVFGNDSGTLTCLDGLTGERIWERECNAPIYTTVAVSGQVAFFGACDNRLHAVGVEDGQLLGEIDLTEFCVSSAAVADGRIIQATGGGRVVCHTFDGAGFFMEEWLFDRTEDEPMMLSAPAVYEDVVVIGAQDRCIYGLDLVSGRKLWSVGTHGLVDSAPVISAGRVYVGSDDKKLYVLDARSGHQIWTFTARAELSAAPAIGSGVLVIGDYRGNVYCLEPGEMAPAAQAAPRRYVMIGTGILIVMAFVLVIFSLRTMRRGGPGQTKSKAV